METSFPCCRCPDCVKSLYSYKNTVYAWTPYILILLLIVCACNIAIWKKQQESVTFQQQNRAFQNKRLSKALLLFSVLALLLWLPLVVVNFLIACHVSLSSLVSDLVVDLNYSNSFVNPILYELKIPEFKQALALCCLGREVTINTQRR